MDLTALGLQDLTEKLTTNESSRLHSSSYGGGVLYPPAVNNSTNFFRRLLDEQVKLKQAANDKHKTDDAFTRFQLRFAHQQEEDRRGEDKRREQAAARCELDRFMQQAKHYPEDVNGRFA